MEKLRANFGRLFRICFILGQDSEISGSHKNIHVIEGVPQMEISSSFIRKSIKEGKDISYLMPEKAWIYTDEMNFYR